MLDSFFIDNDNWVNYSVSHYVNLIVYTILGIVFIYLAKRRWNDDQKHSYWLYLCIGLTLIQYTKLFIKIYLGTFDYTIDLPLELCNMLPIFMALAIYYKSQKWWAILFFWIMSGTVQANITPTLLNEIPHYEYWRYWLIHMGLPVASLYGAIIMGYRLDWRDAIRSFFWINVVCWSMFLINMILGSNYIYMQAKPPGKTMYNLLWDWPYYLIQIEFLLVCFFSFWLLVFYLTDKTAKRIS